MSNRSNTSIIRLIQDQSPSKTSPWMPNFRTCFRLLLLARLISALHSNITDCDETYNYWEPLHLLTHPPSPIGQSQAPFQTWEYSPQFAIRSWAYVGQYVPIASTLMKFLGKEKSSSFYATRFFLAFCSSLTEANLLETISKVIHPIISRYMLIFLLFSAGMYESSTALLPSSFVMYTTTLAMSFAFHISRQGEDRFARNTSLPLFSDKKQFRTILATATFALGALLAWPFALVLSFPFVFEELFLPSGLIVSSKRYLEFITLRISRWIKAVLISATLALPIIVIDSLAYARLAIVPLNIITYNILSERRGAGPTLYGVEPWYYYLLNLSLNFGPVLLLALISVPALILLSFVDPTRFSFDPQTQPDVKQTHSKKKDDENSKSNQLVFASSAGTLLVLRLLPLYLWLGLLTIQPHKEERFVYPAYPLLCFNAATGLFCCKIFVEKILAKLTKNQQKNSKTSERKLNVSSLLTGCVLLISSAFSLSRSMQTTLSYKAPFEVLKYLSEEELPKVVQQHFSSKQNSLQEINLTKLLDLRYDNEEEEAIRLCYGKEWHRFPTTYLVPKGVKVDFIKSDFTGILPKHFARGKEIWKGETDEHFSSTLWPWMMFTRPMREGFNDLNLEEIDRYVDVTNCDYLVDVDFPHKIIQNEQDIESNPSSHEKRFLLDKENWQTIFCTNFLDAPLSHAKSDASKLQKIHATIDRAFWLPKPLRGNTNRYGQYCLLKTKRSESVVNQSM